MSNDMDSFSSCETLIRKYAPLMMKVGEYKEPKEAHQLGRVPAKWRPAIHGRTITRMKKLRAQGVTIGEIARLCNVGWQSAFRLSKP